MTVDSDLAVEHMQIADRRWQGALTLSAQAQPDLQFSERLLELADAAEQEASAFQVAAQAGMVWQPVSNASGMTLSYELRRGGPRRGSSELWVGFDQAVARLGTALEGVALSAIARAFGELSDVARELSTDVARIDFPTRARRRTG